MKNGLSLIVNSQATYFLAQHIYVIISRLLSNYLSGIPQSVFGLPSVVWDVIHNVGDSRMADEVHFLLVEYDIVIEMLSLDMQDILKKINCKE